MKEENLKKKEMKQNTFLSICILCVIVAAVGSDAYRIGEIREFEITINFAEVRQSPDENVIWSPPDYAYSKLQNLPKSHDFDQFQSSAKTRESLCILQSPGGRG